MFIIPVAILPAYVNICWLTGQTNHRDIQFDIVYDYDHEYPQPKYSLFSLM